MSKPTPYPQGTDLKLVVGVLAVLEGNAGGGPTKLKTLSEMPSLGRPSVGALRALCNNVLIPCRYAKSAGTTKDGHLKAVELGDVPCPEVEQAKAEHASHPVQEDVEAADPEKVLRRSISIGKLVDNAAREARCAYTQGHLDRRDQLIEEIAAFTEKQWGAAENIPGWVLRKLAKISTDCRCWKCREDRSEESIKRLVKEFTDEADGPFVDLDTDLIKQMIADEVERRLRAQRREQIGREQEPAVGSAPDLKVLSGGRG